MLTLPARWLPGSAVILSLKGTDGGRSGSSEYLFWSVNEHRPCWEGETIVTHAGKKTNKRKNGTTTQEVLPCPSLWDTLQGEETGEEGRRQIMDTVSQGLHWEQTLTLRGGRCLRVSHNLVIIRSCSNPAYSRIFKCWSKKIHLTCSCQPAFDF